MRSSENTGIECDLVQVRYREMDPRWPLQRGFCNSVTQDDDEHASSWGTGEQSPTEVVSYEPGITLQSPN